MEIKKSQFLEGYSIYKNVIGFGVFFNLHQDVWIKKWNDSEDKIFKIPLLQEALYF